MATRIAVALALALAPSLVDGHGYLSYPISRNYRARVPEASGEQPSEWCPHCKSGGGTGPVSAAAGGRWPYPETPATSARHGLCGDAASDSPQTYLARGPVVASFESGGILDVEVIVTAHHRGHFEMLLCDSPAGGVVTQECLNQHILQRAAGDDAVSPPDNRSEFAGRYYLEPPCAQPNYPATIDGSPDYVDYPTTYQPGQRFRARYQLPDGVECEHCVLQWYWTTANTCNAPGYAGHNFPTSSDGCLDSIGRAGWWGSGLNNCGDAGAGYPEEFWNCADIAIASSAPTQPTAPPPPTATPPPITTPPPSTPPPTTTTPSTGIGNGGCCTWDVPAGCQGDDWCSASQARCEDCSGVWINASLTSPPTPPPTPMPTAASIVAGAWCSEHREFCLAWSPAGVDTIIFVMNGTTPGYLALGLADATGEMPSADVAMCSVSSDGAAMLVDRHNVDRTSISDASQDLTLVSASRTAEDLSTCTFVRPLLAADADDRSLVPGPMNVIWAVGRSPADAPTFHEVGHGLATIDFFAAERSSAPTPTPTSPTPTSPSSAPTTPGDTGTPSDKKMVGYYTNWAQYRPDGHQYFPEDIDATLLTHICYAFAILDDTYDVKPFEWNDIIDWNPSQGMYARFHTHVRTQNPDIKTLISLGGWTFNEHPATSHLFTSMAAGQTSRAHFIDSAIGFARTHGFDGVDIDWEYPGHAGQGGRPQDKANFVVLLAEFRAAIAIDGAARNVDPLLLTIAVAAAGTTVNNGYQIDQIHQHLDWIGVMSYDLHGSWEGQTDMHTSMDASAPTSIVSGMQQWMDGGAPANKLVMGFATYGRGWTLASASDTGVGAAAAGGSVPGAITREQGFLAWNEIQNIISNGGTSHYDETTMCMYAVNNDQWVGYDNTATLRIKVDYLADRGFAGGMVWALDLDDFHSGYPLISAIKTGLDAINVAPTTSARTPPPSTFTPTNPPNTPNTPNTQSPTSSPTTAPTNPPTSPPTSPPSTASPTPPPTDPSTSTVAATTTQNPGCQDNDVLCPIWSALGYCVGDHDDHMAIHCQLSCRLCPADAHRTPPRNDDDLEPETTVRPVNPTTSDQTTECHHTACGRADSCAGEQPSCDVHTAVHEVRCCSDTLITGWLQRANSCPWTESNNFNSENTACVHASTFDEANDFCASVGARLCSSVEAEADCLRGTGCGHDRDLVWTSDAGRTSAAVPQMAMEIGDASLDVVTTSTAEPATDGQISMLTGTGNALEASSSSASTAADTGASAGAMAGAVIGTLVLIALIATVLVRQRQRRANRLARTVKQASQEQATHTGPTQHVAISDPTVDATFTVGNTEASLRVVSVRRGNPKFRESIIAATESDVKLA